MHDHRDSMAKRTGFIKKGLLILRGEGMFSLLRKVISRFFFKVRKYYFFFKFIIKNPKQTIQRYKVFKRFRNIHRSVTCGHSEAELLHIADEILKVPSRVKGDIIECGVWKGGGTCKLSVVARMTGRKLIACDSFEGLPDPTGHDRRRVGRNGRVKPYKKGDFTGSIEEVKANLRQFGEIECVEFVKGWFYDTLPKLRNRRAVLIFIDVDLQESIRSCVENLWQILVQECKFFVHEARDALIIKLLNSRSLWKKIGEESIIKFKGAGRGLGPLESDLGYLQKP